MKKAIFVSIFVMVLGSFLYIVHLESLNSKAEPELNEEKKVEDVKAGQTEGICAKGSALLFSEDKVREAIHYWNELGTPGSAYTDNPEDVFSKIGFVELSGGLEQASLCFLEQYIDVFKLVDPRRELKMIKINKDDFGFTHVVFNRIFKNISVSGSQLIMHFNSRGQIYGFNGRYHPTFDIDISPKISKDKAIEIAEKESGTSSKNKSVEIIIYTYPNKVSYILSWYVSYPTAQYPSQSFIIDANNGNIIISDTGIRTLR